MKKKSKEIQTVDVKRFIKVMERFEKAGIKLQKRIADANRSIQTK
jgi:hypothetical protein